MMSPILKTTLFFSTLISLKAFGAGLPDVENVPPPPGGAPAEAAPVSPPHAAIDPAFVTPPDQPTKPASTNAPKRPRLERDPLVDRVLRFED